MEKFEDVTGYKRQSVGHEDIMQATTHVPEPEKSGQQNLQPYVQQSHHGDYDWEYDNPCQHQSDNGFDSNSRNHDFSQGDNPDRNIENTSSGRKRKHQDDSCKKENSKRRKTS